MRFVTESTVITDKDWVANPSSLEQTTKKPGVPTDVQPTERLQKTMDQPKLDMQRLEEESISPPADPNDLKPAEYATDEVVGHRRAKDRTECELRWYGFRAEN